MRSQVLTGHSGCSEFRMAAFLVCCVGCGVCNGGSVLGLKKTGWLWL